jgi:hypothetical protein
MNNDKFDMLINVGIFNSTILGINYPPRGLLHRDDQLDIFKYTLASLKAIDPLINKVYIYVELESYFQSRKNELQEYTKELFRSKLVYHNRRNLTQQQWQDTTKQIERDTVWFLCNHDHFFVDSSLDLLKSCLRVMRQDDQQYKAIHYSHSPELLPTAVLSDNDNGLHYMDMSPDSIQIVNKETLKYWWFNQAYNRTFRRTDEKGYAVNIPTGKCYVPPSELCCHYDGYWIPGHYQAYVIPPKFFEKQVKIRYGYNDRHPECVNINPSATNYSDVDHQGADYKWVLKDIPLFWQEHICDIDINPLFDQKQALIDRNIAKLNSLKSRLWSIADFNQGNLVRIPEYTQQLEDDIDKYIKQGDTLYGHIH